MGRYLNVSFRHGSQILAEDEDENDDEYDSGITQSKLVLVLLLVLGFGVLKCFQ